MCQLDPQSVAILLCCRVSSALLCLSLTCPSLHVQCTLLPELLWLVVCATGHLRQYPEILLLPWAVIAAFSDDLMLPLMRSIWLNQDFNMTYLTQQEFVLCGVSGRLAHANASISYWTLSIDLSHPLCWYLLYEAACTFLVHMCRHACACNAYCWTFHFDLTTFDHKATMLVSAMWYSMYRLCGYLQACMLMPMQVSHPGVLHPPTTPPWFPGVRPAAPMPPMGVYSPLHHKPLRSC